MLVIKWRLVRECSKMQRHKDSFHKKLHSTQEEEPMGFTSKSPQESATCFSSTSLLYTQSFGSFFLLQSLQNWSTVITQFTVLSLSLSPYLSTLVALQIAAESNIVKQKLIFTNIASVYADLLLLLLLSWV